MKNTLRINLAVWLFTVALLPAVTVTQLVQAQTYSALYEFNGPPADGQWPAGNLFRDAAGDLYGTASAGGDFTCGGFPCGIVFKLNTANREKVLYNFAGSPADGDNPKAGLISDASGNLYGTTENGAPSGLEQYSR
jgi:uncharacterized repeat protein (TIGR03803 family)